MAILHTWLCAAHGEFQSFNQACPHGCSELLVTKVLGCAISVGKSKDKAQFIDRKMVDIANQFGVGDLDVRAGRSSAPSEFRWNEPEHVKRMRLAGQTYSVPVDPKGDALAQVGGHSTTGLDSSEVNVLQEMKQAGALKMRMNIDPRMNDTSVLPERL